MWYFIAKLLSLHNAQRSHCHISLPPQLPLQAPALIHQEPADRKCLQAALLPSLRAGAGAGWQDLPQGEEQGKVGVGGFGAAPLLREQCGAGQFIAELRALPSSCCACKLCPPGDFHSFHQSVFHLVLGASGQRR